MSVLDDIRNYYSTNIQPFLSGGLGYLEKRPERGPSVITPKLLPREKLANTNIINVREPALPQQVVSPGVVSDFNFSPQTGNPVNEFAPVQGQTNLDRVRAGQTDTDSKSLFDLIGSNSDADKYLALALGGFSMAEAAGKPGATFLSSLGSGGKAGIAGAIAARTAARKEATAKTVADARLAAARAKSTGLSTAYKDAKFSLPPGTSEADIRNEAKRLITARLPSDESKRTGKLGLAHEMFPGDTPEAAAERKQWLSLSDLGQDKAARAVRMLQEIEASNAYTDTTDLGHDAAKLAHKRWTASFEAANAEAKIASQASKIGLMEQKLEFQKELPQRKAESTSFVDIRKKFNTLPMYHRSTLKMARVLNTGKVATGGLQPTITSFNSVLRSIGVDIQPYLETLGIKTGDLARGEFTQAQQIGLMTAILRDKTYGNNPSNRDVEIILKSLPGLGVTPEANARIIWNLQQETERQLQMTLGDAQSFEYVKTAKWQETAKKRLAALQKSRNKEFERLQNQVRTATNRHFARLGRLPTVADMETYESILKSQGGEQYRRYVIHKTYDLLRSGGI
jgi:hypothetical protein